MQNSTSPLIHPFKIFQHFHCFYYSRHNNDISYLLRKKNNGTFCHIKGHLDDLEPAIVFSLGRKIMKLSSGLLMKQNLNFFTKNQVDLTNLRDMVQLCKPNLQIVSHFVFKMNLIESSRNYRSQNCFKGLLKKHSKT